MPGRVDPALEHPRRRLRALLQEVALERHQDRAFLLGREPVGEVEAAVVGLEHVHPYSGMFPCLRAGTLSRFVESMRSAWISRGRVSAGSITSSMNPRSAAAYGVENLSRVLVDQLGALAPPGRPPSRSPCGTRCSPRPRRPSPRSRRSATRTTTSARRCFEFMTRYAPPYALRVITVIRGTVASANAYSSFAPWRMIPSYSCSLPGRKPGHVDEREDRDVERVAEPHEPRRLLARVDVERAARAPSAGSR